MKSPASEVTVVVVRGSLVARVFLGFLVIEATFVLLAWLSVREIHQMAQEIRALRDGQLATSRHVARLAAYEQKWLKDLDRFFETEADVNLALAASYYPRSIRRAMMDIRAVVERRINLDTARDTAPARARVADFRRLLDQLEVLERLHVRLDAALSQLFDAISNQRPIEPVRDALTQLEAEIKTQQLQLETLLNRATDGAVARAAAEERRATDRVVVFSALGLSMGLLVTILLARAMAPIRRLVLYARAISRGDYDQRLEVPRSLELASLAEELALMAKNRKEREAELDHQAAELERAYRRVEDLKRYHERIVRSVRTALVVTDRNLMVTSINPAAEHHWGLSQAQVRAQSLDSLALGQVLIDRFGALHPLVDHDEPIHEQSVPVGRLLADVTVAPLKSEKGASIGLVVSLEDVTEAVHTKEALIRSERLATIGRMSAHVTHEIRNPLSSIGLNAEMLSDWVADLPTGAGEDAAKLCTAIVREVDRLSAITEEYLRFVRLPQCEVRSTDLSVLLATLASFVRRDCEAAQVSIVQQVEADLPRITIDPDQIRQALLNLLRNGKEAMPAGGTLVLGARRSHLNTIELFVRDTGTGIRLEDQERIFDPFYSTKLTGTGLGLALTQQIIAEHGAKLSVKSAPGHGTEFVISFTLIQETEIIDESAEGEPVELGAS